ncbi:IclR family transcriptional regulator [Bacillus sp. Hm123]|uniref:IclR family transcriptional regulator n=1 Tax=Bacillus sp. Hm123 TaxID=3450745 RepID=UPI003F43D3AC
MNKTVLKSMEIIQLFFNEEQQTLQEIVEKTSLPKTSAYRMAESLYELGFLQKNDEGAYKLGLLFLQLGQLVAERLEIRKVALPMMHELRKETGEAVNLIIREKDEAVYIEKVDTTERVRVYTQIGRRAPLYAGACPRILLAFLSAEEKEGLINRATIKKYADGTIVDKDVLRQMLVKSREEGYSISHSELENYSSAVAAPIFDHMGKVIAGISLVGPEARFQDEAHVEFLIIKLKKSAEKISKEMGWKGDIRDEGTDYSTW